MAKLLHKSLLTLALTASLLAIFSPGMACSNVYNITMPGAKADDEAEARQLYAEVSLPTVLVYCAKDGQTLGSGSGVVFGDGSLVLTAAHVVSQKEATTDQNGNPAEGPLEILEVAVHKYASETPFISGGTVIKIDDSSDLAIIRLARSYPYAKATFASHEPYLYQKCWASGHPHGVIATTVTEGRIQALWDDGFIRYSALTTFGNSGGPVFVKIDGKFYVSSIVQMVHTEGYGIATTHMGLGCLPKVVLEFVEGVL